MERRRKKEIKEKIRTTEGEKIKGRVRVGRKKGSNEQRED